MNANNPPPPPSPAAEREFVARLLAEHERQAHTGQLTAAEIIALRELLESDRRWKWIVSSLKTLGLWITAVAAAATVGVDALKALVKSLGS